MPKDRADDPYMINRRGVGQPSHTENARDRDPGILTYDDREYLLGQKDIMGDTESQLRQRMRDRIWNGLLDFELLFWYLDDQEIRTIFTDYPGDPNENDRGTKTYDGVVHMLAFLYYSITECVQGDFERMLQDGIALGASSSQEATKDPHNRFVDITLDLEVDWVVENIDIEYAMEKFRSDEEIVSDRELGALVRRGDLNEDEWERIREGGEIFYDKYFELDGEGI